MASKEYRSIKVMRVRGLGLVWVVVHSLMNLKQQKEKGLSAPVCRATRIALQPCISQSTILFRRTARRRWLSITETPNSKFLKCRLEPQAAMVHTAQIWYRRLIHYSLWFSAAE